MTISENKVNIFIKKILKDLEFFDNSVIKNYCDKNINNFKYILNNDPKNTNLAILGEQNLNFFQKYAIVESEDFIFSIFKLKKSNHNNIEVIDIGYIGNSKLICLPSKDSLYDDEDAYNNFNEKGFYSSIYSFIFSELLILKYRNLNTNIDYNEFIKNELQSIN